MLTALDCILNPSSREMPGAFGHAHGRNKDLTTCAPVSGGVSRFAKPSIGGWTLMIQTVKDEKQFSAIRGAPLQSSSRIPFSNLSLHKTSRGGFTEVPRIFHGGSTL